MHPILKKPITLGLSPSVRQWMWSFLAFDIAAFTLIVVGCAIDLEMCGVAMVFALAFFYPYWWLPVPDLGAWGGLGLSTFLVPVYGIVFALLCGYVVGRLLEKAAVSKVISVLLATLFRFAVVLLLNVLLKMTGYII